jgi:hypothetical protein
MPIDTTFGKEGVLMPVPESQLNQEFFAGLRELSILSFPKRCCTCGREYMTSIEFLVATQPLRTDASGLKQSQDDDGHSIVDVFRNCVCGSTLLESYSDRRDIGAEGIKRRQLFHDQVTKLVALGYPADRARSELIKYLHAQPNRLLNL